MNETTANFWQAWNQHVWTQPVASSFRAYYDASGWVYCYTMEDLPGDYIEIDAQTYQLGPVHAKVVNGILTVMPRPVTVSKLAPNHSTGTPCDPRDVCVIVNANKPHTLWSTKTSELN